MHEIEITWTALVSSFGEQTKDKGQLKNLLICKLGKCDLEVTEIQKYKAHDAVLTETLFRG